QLKVAVTTERVGERIRRVALHPLPARRVRGRGGFGADRVLWSEPSDPRTHVEPVLAAVRLAKSGAARGAGERLEGGGAHRTAFAPSRRPPADPRSRRPARARAWPRRARRGPARDHTAPRPAAVSRDRRRAAPAPGARADRRAARLPPRRPRADRSAGPPARG